MDSFLVSDDSVEVTAQNGNSNPTVDDFVVTYGTDAGSFLIVKVYMPVDGELQAVKLTGDFLDAKIEVQKESTAIPQLAIPKTGDNKLTPDEYVTFADTPFAPGDIEIRINIQPGTAGTITVEEFKVCTEIGNLCKINTDEVETALGFKPADDMFGVTAEGEVVEVDSLTYISVNVTITGYCYVCECKGNNKLECSFTKNCTEECPDFSEWSECDADCGEQGTRTRTIDDIGFPDSCPSGSEEQPCDGSCFTSPVPCVSSWGEWSPCEGCTQKRNRTCKEDSAECDCSQPLEEIRECGSCTTTATTPTSTIECEENEEYGCTTSESRCEESCMAFRAANDTCRGNELPCTPACECKDGFKRNSQGKCVPHEQCECYPRGSNSSIPIGHVVHVDECYECECLETGYKCGSKAGCCKVGEWTDWSACSVTCGEGTKTRTRDNEGDCDNPKTETETISCDIPCECEDDTEWYDGCEKCKCINGFADCMPFCEEVTEETCDNKTSVIIDDPEQPCCKKCVQVKNPCRPVREDTVRLNFTDPDRSGGVCVSEPVDIQRCKGSCSDSFMSTKYVFSDGSFSLVKDVGSCECCRPSIVKKEVTFFCGNNVSRTVMVPQIARCVCELCAEPPRS